MKVKILLVEDENTLAELLVESLEAMDYEVSRAKNGEEGFSLYQQYNPHICIFDIMMPVCDGFSLLEKIRKKDKKTFIIMLTAKAMKKDIIKGLELGADDYITKPFSFKELNLRIKTILKRSLTAPENKQIGEYTFNFNKQTLQYQYETRLLTPMEADVLNILYKYRNTVLDRKKMLLEVWGNDDFFNSRSIDVFISKLRKYFANDKTIKIINVRGVGYKMLVY